MPPWIYEGKPFERVYGDLCLNHHHGFIYQITNRVTGQSYIGKKAFHSFRKKKPKCESNWRNYISSSDSLNISIINDGISNYDRVILCLCKTPDELDYREVQQMFLHDVLYSTMQDGNPAYYNQCIPGFFVKRDTNR